MKGAYINGIGSPLTRCTCLPSNRVISSLEGKFGTVGDTFVLVLEPLFMNQICVKTICEWHNFKNLC